MASSFYDLLSYLLWFSLMLMLFPVSFTTPVRTLCRNDERYALLQLKQSFSISGDASSDPLAYPKVASWGLVHHRENASTSTDCCSWDGVECDRKTGHVVGLDLSSSCLKGSINSSSSLFHLLHLQKLNLACNNFNYSHIPSQLRLLTSLTYLNLTNSVFTGKVPLELAELSNLTSLDLGKNYHASCDIISLARNLTRLDTLVLRHVNLSSTLPNFWANLSSLTYMDLSHCELWGPLPSSIGELTQVTYLQLGWNSFSGMIPSSFGKLKKLLYLNLYGNDLSGQIPMWLTNLTQIAEISLGENNFHGTISGSIFSSLVDLQYLNLRFNYLTGTVNFGIFLSLKHLKSIHMSGNSFSLVNMVGGSNATSPKFSDLTLGNCNLGEFPDFLRHQDRLSWLSLHGNNIQGLIPKWIGDVLSKTMIILVLSDNHLTGFEQSSVLSSFSSLELIELSGNRIQGPVPIPPPSTIWYYVSLNLLTGEIPPSICSLPSLVVLDLSSNNLSGKIQRCLGNLSVSLLILNFANNSFNGSIPDTFSGGSRLRMINLSRNRLEGGLPRSLANCKILESLDLSENQISDTFPFWLGTLPGLQLLSLRSNLLFGAIESQKKYSEFSRLQILDLSCNNFTGILPVGLLQKLSSMKSFSLDQLEYMQSESLEPAEAFNISYVYQSILANRGRYMTYTEISKVMAVIDLSNNGFQGHIPPAIGSLKMIIFLNLSNNNLSDSIPSNLGDLTRLESLDLSHNMLSGEIPVQLVQLTFLAYFNVSHNQLEGLIPQGKQFDTFQNDSYIGNSGLCGHPLTKKCVDPKAPFAQHPSCGKEHRKGITMDVGLIMVLMGYGSGLVVGLVIGHRFTTWKGGWFLKKFGSRERANRKNMGK